MGMDIDYLAIKDSVEELEGLVNEIPHGKRRMVADDIEKFVTELILKHKKIDYSKVEEIDY